MLHDLLAGDNRAEARVTGNVASFVVFAQDNLTNKTVWAVGTNDNVGLVNFS